MGLLSRVSLAFGAGILTCSSGAVAQSTSNVSTEQLLDKISNLESEVAELRAASDENWLTEQRAEEIRGLVHDVLADADTRASLMQSGMTAGYDNGAVLSSADGNWMLRANLLLQARFTYSHQRNSPTDNDVYGFDVPRAKFMISGHVINPDWFYRVDINVGVGANPAGSFVAPGTAIPTDDSRVGITNGYVGYNYGNGFQVTMGQYMGPFSREDLVEAQYQLGIDRSVLNYANTTGYVTGIMGEYQTDQWRAAVSFDNGSYSAGTTWETPDVEYAATGRFEFLVMGNWEQFEDFTSPPGGEQGLMIGAAIRYQHGEWGTGPATITQPQGGQLLPPDGVGGQEWAVTQFTADISWEFGGGNIFASFFYNESRTFVSPNGSAQPFGFLVQGGYYLDNDWELYARYEYMDTDINGADDISLVSVGVNRYFAGHNAKWSTELGYGINPMNAFVPSSLTGWRQDSGSGDQFMIRTQVQILF